VTKLDHPIIRSTGIFERGEEIIVELQPRRLVVRLKGKRSDQHTITYDELLEVLRWRDARAAVVEKQKAKRAAAR